MGAENFKSLNLHLDEASYSFLLDLEHLGKASESFGHRQLISELTRVTSFSNGGLDCNYFYPNKDKTDNLQAAKL